MIGVTKRPLINTLLNRRAAAAPRSLAGSAAAASASGATAASTADYDALKGISVLRASDGAPVELTSLWRVRGGGRGGSRWGCGQNLIRVPKLQKQKTQKLTFSRKKNEQPEPGARAAVVFLTHFGDLTTFELSDKLRRRAIGPLADAGVPVRVVCLVVVVAGLGTRFFLYCWTVFLLLLRHPLCCKRNPQPLNPLTPSQKKTHSSSPSASARRKTRAPLRPRAASL